MDDILLEQLNNTANTQLDLAFLQQETDTKILKQLEGIGTALAAQGKVFLGDDLSKLASSFSSSMNLLINKLDTLIRAIDPGQGRSNKGLMALLGAGAVAGGTVGALGVGGTASAVGSLASTLFTGLKLLGPVVSTAITEGLKFLTPGAVAGTAASGALVGAGAASAKAATIGATTTASTAASIGTLAGPLGIALGATIGLILASYLRRKPEEQGQKVQVVNFQDLISAEIAGGVGPGLITRAIDGLKSVLTIKSLLPDWLRSVFTKKETHQTVDIGNIDATNSLLTQQVALLSSINMSVGGVKPEAEKEKSNLGRNIANALAGAGIGTVLGAAVAGPIGAGIGAALGGLGGDSLLVKTLTAPFAFITGKIAGIFGKKKEISDSPESKIVTGLTAIATSLKEGLSTIAGSVAAVQTAAATTAPAKSRLQEILSQPLVTAANDKTVRQPGTTASRPQQEYAMAAAGGGSVPGQDGVGENEDNVDIKATKGEFVVNKSATEKHRGLLEGINSGHFAAGGLVGHYDLGGVVAAGSAVAGGITTAITSLGVPLATVGIALAAIVPAITLAKISLDAATFGLTAFVQVLTGTVKSVLAFGEALISAPWDLMRGAAESFGKLASGDFYGAMSSGATSLIKTFDNVAQSGLNIIPIFGGILAGILGKFTGAMTDAIQVATGFAQNMLPFVQAISPAITENFQQQIKNLQATIGLAFQGFVSQMADLIQLLGGVIQPLAEEVAPIFNQLGDTIKAVVLVLARVGVAFVQTLLGPLEQAMSGLTYWVKDATKSFVTLVAVVARFFGLANAGQFLQRLRGAFQRRDQAGATAVGNASISNFEQIAKDIAVAAARSSTGGGSTVQSVSDLLIEINATLEEISEEGLDELSERILNMWDTFTTNIQGWWESAMELWNRLLRWFNHDLGPLLSDIWDRRIVPWVNEQIYRNVVRPATRAAIGPVNSVAPFVPGPLSSVLQAASDLLGN